MSKISVIIPAYNVGHFIKRMLSALENQTFRDFEVLIINDGSEDNTAEVAEEYCKKDRRFHLYTQENQGVSAARNKGMELAEGTYLVFYDADDKVPKDALENLFLTAEARDADVVIGGFRVNRMYESKKMKSAVRLSKKEVISPFDTDLLWNFSVCNKLFRKACVDEMQLRFDTELKIMEDGLFVTTIIHHCSQICGCPHIVYEYMKRPFWEETSATQDVSADLFENICRAFEKVEQIIRADTEIQETGLSSLSGEEQQQICRKLTCRATLYKRFVKSDILTGHYRNLWSGKTDFSQEVQEQLRYCREQMFPDMWQDLLNKTFGLHLAEGIRTRRQAAERPDITILLSKELPGEHVNEVIHSCYEQELPFFEILADEELKGYIDSRYLEKENFHIVDRDVPLMQQVLGKYAIVLSEDILLLGNTLKAMMKHLEADNLAQCVTVPVMKLKGSKLVKAKEKGLKRKKRPASNMLFKAGFLACGDPETIQWCETELDDAFVLKYSAVQK
ncbi:MAG: glycosyltransferase family 2 protein [Firmicutes bacterium]|nr:glycosyltransferase family 2 protein [Bacillota bacterium]